MAEADPAVHASCRRTCLRYASLPVSHLRVSHCGMVVCAWSTTVRVKIIGHEIIKHVGEYESCMVSKLPIIFKHTRSSPPSVPSSSALRRPPPSRRVVPVRAERCSSYTVVLIRAARVVCLGDRAQAGRTPPARSTSAGRLTRTWTRPSHRPPHHRAAAAAPAQAFRRRHRLLLRNNSRYPRYGHHLVEDAR